MDEHEAREVKAQLADYARQLSERVVRPADVSGGSSAPVLALGLARQQDGSYQLAVRYRLGLSSVRSVARKVVDKIGPDDADVRRTGRIRGLDDTTVRPRPPVIRAQSLGETGRVRPLRPGVSIGHVDVSAGTLGAFVRVDGEVHVLSNYHVLSGTPAAEVGDVVLQPGRADGGSAPEDGVATLARRVELEPDGRGVVDCAIARLEGELAQPDLQYPVGRITTTAVVLGGESVGKIGRTTAMTHGRVTAIELDDVVVGYGEELGELTFDNQIEVESTGTGPFSRGGDSGSLVYREDGVAIGLLFAGSESGGDNGSGLTYVNPIDAVLAAFGATLL
ncbi:trypsin-like peptidase domain-containing protein [Cellulomonas sp. McL0617]|uniref:trypsin-like peptidase domain-containing protein n=1 Tax=Cellulomonas sp. McL0617 TaxID=3415675 RepID=UPI003CF0374D